MNRSGQDQRPERQAFKDYFDREAIAAISKQMTNAWGRFPATAFTRHAVRGLEELEFHQRVNQIADSLRENLPTDIPEALKVLQNSLPRPLPNCDSVTDGWLQWPLGHFIGKFGLDAFAESMEAMVQLTQRFSSEFAVRPFVDQYQSQTIQRLSELTSHTSPHVRRWCSEGIRPRLPWGRKLKSLIKDPQPILPILDALHDDTEVYVRRSVANNLNDIAKDHPELVIERCDQYLAAKSQHAEWLTRHALRTLIKKGHPDALRALGFYAPDHITAELTVHPAKIMIGDSVELTAALQNGSSCDQRLTIDFELTLVRLHQKTSSKVFKWKTLTLPAGGVASILKRHPMKATSVRPLYSGEHKLRLMVNGQPLASASFDFDAG